MTKIIVCPTSINNTYGLLKKDIGGVILGLKGYSVFINFEVTIKDIKNILKNTDKEVYIAINKVIYNKDIKKIKLLLRSLSKLNIKGILFESISIVNINKEEKLNLNLIWNQAHLVTNYNTCNFWYKNGVTAAYLSTEITKEDIINIKNNTDLKVFTYLYGYLPMFESSRKLITNFLKYNNLHKKNEIYYLYEEQRKQYYLIYEKNNETYILENIINGIRELNDLVKNNIDYIVLNGLFIKEKDFNLVIDSYIKVLNGENVEEIYNKMNNNNTGFLYKETVYKVKL